MHTNNSNSTIVLLVFGKDEDNGIKFILKITTKNKHVGKICALFFCNPENTIQLTLQNNIWFQSDCFIWQNYRKRYGTVKQRAVKNPGNGKASRA